MSLGAKKYLSIVPRSKASHLKQLDECLSVLEDFLSNNVYSKTDILKQTLFINANKNSSSENYYYSLKNILQDSLKEFYNHKVPPTSIVAQEPFDNNVAVELLLLKKSEQGDEFIEYKKEKNETYSIINHKYYKEIIAAGLTSDNLSSGVMNQVSDAFGKMDYILKNEGMEFSDVIRQWNYIENILNTNTEKKSGCKKLLQNYQIFNDIRAKYYNKSQWNNGYPAATGIGMNSGGIIIDFIAIKEKKIENSTDSSNNSNILSIIPLRNPRQTDAHKYSQEVLVGKAVIDDFQKSPPKFERGKILSINYGNEINQKRIIIYVSGTAAILGQKTVSGNNIERQTITTIENIAELITEKSLLNYGIDINLELKNSIYLRAYVKYKKDIPIIRNICNKYFGECPAQYVVCDICRDDLLVEIECEISI